MQIAHALVLGYQSFQHRKRSGEFIVEANDLGLLIGGEVHKVWLRPGWEVGHVRTHQTKFQFRELPQSGKESHQR